MPFDEFGFWVEPLGSAADSSSLLSESFGQFVDSFTDDQVSVLETAGNLYDVVAAGIGDQAARVFSSEFRTECLSVRVPGLPGGEYLAGAADWWAQQAVDFFGGPVRTVGNVNEHINGTIQDALGIPGVGGHPADSRPRARPGLAPGDDGFLVSVPNWQDIFQFNNDAVFDERSKKQRALDYAEALRRSPTPPALAEVGELLTTLDDLQDEAATLAVVLMIAEKLAGRAIPGVGWVATAADALNIIYALASPATGSGLPGSRSKGSGKGGSGLPGKRSKRMAVDKAKHSSGGLGARLEELRRSGSLKIGIGDLLQGLQATDSVFGTGIQLGAVFGFLQEAFWGGVRGAEFKAQGPAWDPLGFTEAGRSACYRSPTLDQVHPKAYFSLANSALSVWSKASRVTPYLEVLGEQALASTLTGLRMSEQVLGPWLRSGVWVDPLIRAIELTPRVGGGVEEHGTRNLRPDEWLKRTVPAARVGVKRAIGNVADRGRQAFYESLVASTGWGLIGSIEPAAKILGQQPLGFAGDAYRLLDAGKIPVFDLGD